MSDKEHIDELAAVGRNEDIEGLVEEGRLILDGSLGVGSDPSNGLVGDLLKDGLDFGKVDKPTAGSIGGFSLEDGNFEVATTILLIVVEEVFPLGKPLNILRVGNCSGNGGVCGGGGLEARGVGWGYGGWW